MSGRTVPTPPAGELVGLPCLTVHQPWAELIVSGRKWAENRTWPTDHRGRLGVHAGLTRPAKDALELGGISKAGDLPLGMLVGTVEVVDCVRKQGREDAAFERDVRRSLEAAGVGPDGGWKFIVEDSPFVWLLADPVRFETPVSKRGRTMIWRF